MSLRLLTKSEVSQILRIHPNTLKNWVKSGAFPLALETGGRRLLWPEKLVCDWIKEKQSPSHASVGTSHDN